LSNYLKYNQLTDAELIAEYKNSQNQELLATLYTRYDALVYGVCLKYFKEPEMAKDAGIDIYEELTTKVLKHEIDNFKGWLHVLSKNHCLMKLRSSKKQQFVEFSETFMQFEENEHLNGVMQKEENLTQMEKCIETLTVDQKKAVTLFYIHEKSYNQITEITGQQWNEIRSLIQNGRRNLKICMDKSGKNQ
jgi:RNA polymerase sigma factor (sigma-70 family)